MVERGVAIFLLIGATFIATTTANDPLYTITAPKSLLAGSTYQIVVTVHKSPSPVEVTATLRALDQNETELFSSATLQSGETKILEIDVRPSKANSYNLNIVGTGGISFNKTDRVHSRSKSFSIFIQTDKAMYQPGQLVHYRVIATDSLLKPYSTEEASIYINDAGGNRIKQLKNVTLTKGVYTGELQLSSKVVLGDWGIKAQIKNTDEYKSFTVAEYVLPTFEVNVDLTPIVTYNESDVVATVTAKYTYGKPVKGEVTLNVSDYYCQHPCVSSSIKPYTVKTEIDGKAELKLNMLQDLGLPEWYRYGGRKFVFFASVKEGLTGRVQNGTQDMTLYDTKHRLEFIDMQTFKPGLQHTATLKVQMQDGSPVIDKINNVHVFYKYGWDEKQVELVIPVPETGLIMIDTFPPENADTIQYEAKFMGANAYSNAQRAQSLSERYMQLNLLNKNPKVGDEVELLVNGTKDLVDPLVVQVVGRGKILYTANLPGSKTKSQNFKVKLTPEMAPKIRVIIYYATGCGEVVADALDFGIEGVFKTPVKVGVSPNSTEPGSPIEVNVATHPNAFVGLLAVDQSVLLLKSGNDLSSEKVLQDLQGYEIGYTSPYYYGSSFRPWRPSSTTTNELFTNVGLLFLTNGLIARVPSHGGYGGGYPGLAAPRPVAFHTTTANRQDIALKRPALSSASGGLIEPTRVRRYFPETFLWTNVTADAEGKVNIKADAPDTITSYVINAFAMDEVNGLGLADAPAKMQIFRPFFVSLNLPYSVVRGETVSLQALVFNYLKEDVEAVVTLDNKEGNFEFMDLENEIVQPEDQTELTKTVKVPAGQGASVKFAVTPKKLGYVDLQVKARSTVAADALVKKLLVKAEGTTVYVNKAVLVDLRQDPNFEETVEIEIPDDIVPDSESLETSSIGDIMGTTVNNLDSLLRMPSGCGEQNMLNFVPNIVIADYLSATGQLTDEIKEKAVRHMEAGYQGELTYKRYDGSFSAFGNSDKNGSTWLTAFVVKSFIQAHNHITMDEDVVNVALNWLARTQLPNGTFAENGTVFHKAMQGGSASGLSLTSYVLSAFLESRNSKFGIKDSTDVNHVINSSLTLIEKQVAALDSTYDVILATYVLHLANSPVKDAAFEKLNKLAVNKGDLRYWSAPLPEVNASDPYSYYNRPRSVDVEMTSYALQIYALRNQVSDAIPIMRWLISKRNSNGGFESTQDTVVGIQGLGKFGEKLAAPKDSSVAVKVSHPQGEKSFTLNRENALVLHRNELPKDVRKVTVSATGNGVAVVQITWSYNVLTKSAGPAFELNVESNTERNDISIKSCATYTRENEESNMAVMEIGFPSGYVADREFLPTISEETKIKKVETKDGDSVVIVYFDKIGKEVCTNAKANQVYKVAEMKPASVNVYDYYDPALRGQVYYEPPKVSVCDLCESPECKQKCK